MDIERLRKELGDKVVNTPVYTNEQIDTRIYKIKQALLDAIEVSTPWIRQSPYTKDFWTKEYDTVIHEVRRAYYNIL